jgi:hypothetical protein
LDRAYGNANIAVIGWSRSRTSSPSREGVRTESRQNCEPKGVTWNRSGDGADPDIGDHQNHTVNTLPQTVDVSVENIFSLKINDTVSRKMDESCCHRDFSWHNLEKQMRTASMKVTDDTTSKKIDDNYCHRDFRWHNLEK